MTHGRKTSTAAVPIRGWRRRSAPSSRRRRGRSAAWSACAPHRCGCRGCRCARWYRRERTTTAAAQAPRRRPPQRAGSRAVLTGSSRPRCEQTGLGAGRQQGTGGHRSMTPSQVAAVATARPRRREGRAGAVCATAVRLVQCLGRARRRRVIGTKRRVRGSLAAFHPRGRRPPSAVFAAAQKSSRGVRLTPRRRCAARADSPTCSEARRSGTGVPGRVADAKRSPR
jgi:hypothetical protein